MDECLTCFSLMVTLSPELGSNGFGNTADQIEIQPAAQCLSCEQRVCDCVPLPVVAVEVVQPAALLHQLDGARAVPPGGVAVRALVLVALAALHTTLVRLLQLVVYVVVQTLSGVDLPVAQSCTRAHRHTHNDAVQRGGVQGRVCEQHSLCFGCRKLWRPDVTFDLTYSCENEVITHVHELQV